MATKRRKSRKSRKIRKTRRRGGIYSSFSKMFSSKPKPPASMQAPVSTQAPLSTHPNVNVFNGTIEEYITKCYTEVNSSNIRDYRRKWAFYFDSGEKILYWGYIILSGDIYHLKNDGTNPRGILKNNNEEFEPATFDMVLNDYHKLYTPTEYHAYFGNDDDRLPHEILRDYLKNNISNI